MRLCSDTGLDWQVVATRDIRRGEEILFIPDKLVVSLDKINDIPCNSFINWNHEIGGKLIKKESNALA